MLTKDSGIKNLLSEHCGKVYIDYLWEEMVSLELLTPSKRAGRGRSLDKCEALNCLTIFCRHQ